MKKVEGLVVTISWVSPLILRKVGGAKTWFFRGAGFIASPPSKIYGGLSTPKPPPGDLHP